MCLCGSKVGVLCARRPDATAALSEPPSAVRVSPKTGSRLINYKTPINGVAEMLLSYSVC